ncbi:MAG: hypothetical protein RLN86_11145 [Cyclobacteriaceae bacterium]
MITTRGHDQRMAKMTCASVYPHYVTTVEESVLRKLPQVIYAKCWQQLMESDYE